jgi:crotonobetainyl-CoA:carnitine CoA-transferase CaiB-like acyl-CoA transferase
MAGLLEGVKVIAFEQVVAMPAATAVLADWGATVIKVEPSWGDWQRSLVSFNRTPLLINNKNGEIELHFEFLNRNKKSVVLNLRTERGREIMLQLLKDADVLVTNYSIDVLEKFALTYTDLKDKFPGLIHCLITGYGTKGPKARDRSSNCSSACTPGDSASRHDGHGSFSPSDQRYLRCALP